MSAEQVEDLYFAFPDCTVCGDGGDMNTDGDGWWCERCGTRWSQNGQYGERVTGGSTPNPVEATNGNANSPTSENAGE